VQCSWLAQKQAPDGEDPRANLIFAFGAEGTSSSPGESRNLLARDIEQLAPIVRNSGDCRPATLPDALKEGAQRSRRFRSSPSGLDQHRSRMRGSTFTDVTILIRLQARLVDRWFQEPPDRCDEAAWQKLCNDGASSSMRPPNLNSPGFEISYLGHTVRETSSPTIRMRRLLSEIRQFTIGACGQHDNYGFALTAQPGGSQGRPPTNTSSQLIVRSWAGPRFVLPGALPGWSHHTPTATRTGTTGYRPISMPVTNIVESPFLENRRMATLQEHREPRDDDLEAAHRRRAVLAQSQRARTDARCLRWNVIQRWDCSADEHRIDKEKPCKPFYTYRKIS
jgi:hypothetical protein